MISTCTPLCLGLSFASFFLSQPLSEDVVFSLKASWLSYVALRREKKKKIWGQKGRDLTSAHLCCWESLSDLGFWSPAHFSTSVHWWRTRSPPVPWNSISVIQLAFGSTMSSLTTEHILIFILKCITHHSLQGLLLTTKQLASYV